LPRSSADDPGTALDELRWRLLSEAVTEAHRGNPGAAHAAWNRLETDVPAGGQAAGYLWYLLRYRIADYLGRRPTDEDLRRLARRRHPRYARVLQGDAQELEDMLLSVFNLIPEDRRITGGRFVVLGVVTLGILLDDPEAQLAEMKPHLAGWWKRAGRGIVEEADQTRHSPSGP
jgi:hypothetical protein